MRKLDSPVLFFGDEPVPTVDEVLAIGKRSGAERAAAAPPPPVEPQRAYDGDGMGPARDYLAAMVKVNEFLRDFAEGARQREAARHMVPPEAAPESPAPDGQEQSAVAIDRPWDNAIAPAMATAGRVMTDAAPDPVLEGRQYAAAPLALALPAIEAAPAAAAALGALLGIGAAGVVLNEARKPPADVAPRPAPVAVPPPREGETPEDVLVQGGRFVGEKGNRQGTVQNLPGGKEAAKELFDRLAKGGAPDTSTTYPGVRRRTRDGKFIGYRETSTSGPPAIDVEDLDLVDEQGRKLRRYYTCQTHPLRVG